MKGGFAYIMANRRNGTIYLGVTSDLVKRVDEHREGLAESFTKRYGCKLLVWFEAMTICRKRVGASFSEGMEAGLEVAIDRGNEFRVGRSLSNAFLNPARAGPGPRPSPGNGENR